MTPEDQANLRHRRRTGLPHVHVGGWLLSREVADIASPLAERITMLGVHPRGRVAHDVDRLTEAVHALVSEAVALIARADAERRTHHLGVEARGRATNALTDLAPRPALPELDDRDITRGLWSRVLVRLAEPYDADLSALLAHARLPGETRGAFSVSERLLMALREVDAAAVNLTRSIDRAELHAAQQRRAAEQAAEQPDPRVADLAALGIELPA